MADAEAVEHLYNFKVPKDRVCALRSNEATCSVVIHRLRLQQDNDQIKRTDRILIYIPCQGHQRKVKEEPLLVLHDMRNKLKVSMFQTFHMALWWRFWRI